MGKYWVSVASYDHVKLGIEKGIGLVSHGREAPLHRMHEGDWLIYYSPTMQFGQKDSLQSFTAIGKIADSKIEQIELFPEFFPYARRINYINVAQFLPIKDLLYGLDFIDNPSKYGYKLRLGFFEITERDFQLIKGIMAPGAVLV